MKRTSAADALLWNVNNLLAYTGLGEGRRISSVAELTRVASSLFVAVYESLFHVRLSGVVRDPKTRESYASNVQRVIDSLASQISMNLRHIRGRLIVQGDVRALSNLVHIFVRIVAIASQESRSEGEDEGDEVYEGRFVATAAAAQDVDSISTHESAFGEGDGHDDEKKNAGGIPRIARSKTRRFWDLDARQLLSTTEAQLQQDAELLEQRRRQRPKPALRGLTSRGVAGETRWTLGAAASARGQVQSSTGEHFMLRKIYSSILGRMSHIEVVDKMEASQKIRRLADETKAYIQSLQREMEDRVEMLRKQIRSTVSTEDRHSASQARIGKKLRAVHTERVERMAESQREDLLQRRRQLLMRGREAHRSLESLKNAEEGF